MKHPLIVREELRELLRHLPPLLKKKIKQGLEEISLHPDSGKELREELLGLRSYRIGEIRIIYRMEETSILLIAIGSRKTIYQKAALELKKQKGV